MSDLIYTNGTTEIRDYSPNKFRKIARGRQVMVRVGNGVLHCKVSKKEFYKCASANTLINGFYYETNPGYIWVTSIN